MRFGPTPLEDAEGGLLAHAAKGAARLVKKGRRLTAADLDDLRAGGVATVWLAREDNGDLHEDDAAERLGRTAFGAGLRIAAPVTGRVNAMADALGLLIADRAAVDAFNAVDEAITLATAAPFALLRPGDLAATLKIIPFAAAGDAVAQAETIGATLRLAPIRGRAVGLIQSLSAHMKLALADKTAAGLAARLAGLESWIVAERRGPHEVAAFADGFAHARAAGAELLLAIGASAIADRRDVIPSAIEAAGGRVTYFGMPVDPGNLLLIGEIDGAPVLGLPGCMRAPALNGGDWVLRRLLADLPVDAAAIRAMGCGGLLKESEGRGAPRVPASGDRRIAGILLAAGAGVRMGGPHKLLADLGGQPVIARALSALSGARLDPLIVVLGRDAAQVRAAIDRPGLRFVENADFAAGMSGSLRAGLAAVPADCAGALIALGDTPFVTADDMEAVRQRHEPAEARRLIRASHEGRSGHPTLIDRSLFAEAAAISGDEGARSLFTRHPEMVATAACGPGVLRDIDDPDDLAAARNSLSRGG